MRYDMLGAPQAKILWSAPSKSRFYYLFWLLELMPGHLRRSILRILVLNPTHEISWSRSGFFSLRGRILRAGPPGPLCFLVFVFSHLPTASEPLGRPHSERLKTLRPGHRSQRRLLPASPTPGPVLDSEGERRPFAVATAKRAKQPSAPVAARRRQDTEVNEGCFLPGPGPEGEGSEASFHAVLHCLDERNDFPSLHSPPDPQALRICTKAFVNFRDTTLQTNLHRNDPGTYQYKYIHTN